MTTYNTGNPVPSADARDRFDNSQTLDELINGLMDRYTNRVGTGITSMTGMERLFNQAQSYRAEHFSELMLKSGYETPVPYSTGLLFERYTQLIERDGEFYRAKPGVIPFTTIGDWATDSANLVAVGDASIRSELGSEYGAELVKLDGRSVADTTRDTVNVKDGRFGAIGDGTYHPLSERYANLGLAQAKYPFATSLAQSIDWAACQKAVNSGKIAWAPMGVYVWTDELTINNSTSNMHGLIGEGIDVWEQLFPALAKKNAVGTHFMMYGTGAKTRTCEGVTDNAVSGGAFANPDPVALDTVYSLTSFHNSNASSGVASTLKAFSCGIYIAPGSRNVALKGFRIHPYFNGIAGYNDTITTALGDNWDVGIFNDNAPDVWIEDVQAVGYWRIAGNYQACVSRARVQGASYHCRYNRVNFQGRVGFLLRGGDTYRMLQRTGSTLDIPWQDSHPFPTSGGFNTNVGNFNFTSCSKVNDPTYGNVLRFIGVTGNTSGVTQVRIASGWGIGGTSIQNYVITGLEHSSGNKASSFAIGLGVSRALEISGGFRQPFFSHGYVQSKEDVLVHLHNIDDLRFVNAQFESNGKRGRMIASPQDINNTRVPYANGSTSITMIACHMAGADEMPLVDRATTGNAFTGVGFWQPRRIHNQDRQIPDSDQLDINPMLTQHFRANLAPGKQFIVRNSLESDLLTVNENSGNLALTTGQLSFSASGAAFINAGSGQVLNFRQGTTTMWSISGGGSLGPGGDATQNLAGSGSRINNSFFAVAPTVTSDARLKVVRGELNASELAAWSQVRAQVYQMLDMVAEKGEDGARLHAGYVAQDVQQAFLDNGLDPIGYALWCEDEVTKTISVLREVVKQKTKTVTDMKEVIEVRDGAPVRLWVPEAIELVVTEQVALVDEEGSPVLGEDGEPRYVNLPVTEAMDEWVDEQVPDGTRLGLRYEQCLVFETAYLRSLVADLTDRVAALEA